MKAKDLIKILQGNPEADVVIDCAPNWHPVDAGVHQWDSDLFMIVEQSELDKAAADSEQVHAFADLAADGREYLTHAPFETEEMWATRMKAAGYVDFVEREDC